MNTAFDVAVRLSMETSGFTTAASMATRLMGDMEGKATAAERAVASIERRMQTTAGVATRYANDVAAGHRAQTAAFNDMNRAISRNDPVGLATASRDQHAAIQATTAAQDSLNASTGRYTALQGQQQTALAATTAAHATLAKAQGGIGRLAVGVGLVGVGVAGVSVMKGWVSAAIDLQSAMTGVQLATIGVGTAMQQASQLTALQDMTYSVAAKTRFSAPDIATIEKLAATSGLNKRTDLISALPTLANAAEVALQMKGVSYQQSVPAFVAVAHQFQAYGGKKFTDVLI